MSEGNGEVTVLLARWREGDSAAFDQLTAMVYDNLRGLAAGYLSSEARGHTLSPTAVVHEAYLRLLGAGVVIQDRPHLLAMAALQMRRVLVDHARQRGRQKRGGDDWRRVTLTASVETQESDAADIVAVHEALERLEALDPRKVQIVDLLVFGGLTVDEAGEALRISASTVNREWRLARAWLRHELKSAAEA